MRFFTACTLALSLALSAPRALSAPTASRRAPARRTTAAVSADALAGLAPFTQFARAAYCPSDKIANWSCGEACDALPGFQPTLTGGDGNAVQLCECSELACWCLRVSGCFRLGEVADFTSFFVI